MDLTPELAAASDTTMAGLIRGREEAQHRMAVAKQRYGENSEVVRSIKAEFDVWQSDIDERLADLKLQMTTTKAPGATATGADPGRLTLAEANDRLKTLREGSAKLKDEVKALRDRYCAGSDDRRGSPGRSGRTRYGA